MGGVEVVKDVAPPPTTAPQPTARPRPTTPPAQPTTPPAAAALFGQAGTEIRNADDANFPIVTFWGRLGKTGDALPISGGYKLRVSAPSGTLDVAFGERWQNAYPGQPSEFRYNAKLELPRTAGAFRAVVVDGSGKEVSDAITGELRDKTHDVLLTWFRRQVALKRRRTTVGGSPREVAVGAVRFGGPMSARAANAGAGRPAAAWPGSVFNALISSRCGGMKGTAFGLPRTQLAT